MCQSIVSLCLTCLEIRRAARLRQSPVVILLFLMLPGGACSAAATDAKSVVVTFGSVRVLNI